MERISGEVEIIEDNWLHIRLDTILPAFRARESTQNVTESITVILDDFIAYGNQLPFYEKAFIVFIEYCEAENSNSFDNDNKGFRAVQNALKGRVFRDDNQFELSLGLFTKKSDEAVCHIYVLPEDDILNFFELKSANELYGGAVDEPCGITDVY